jgi:hypothetical protein
LASKAERITVMKKADQKSSKRIPRSGLEKNRTRELKVELYLEKINQEKIRFSPDVAGCDFYASWTKSCCVLDFSRVKPGDLVSNPTRGLMMRKEAEGGFMWNPRTGAVYKLNEDAYHAILDIENGLSELEVARRNDLDLPAVQTMFERLRSIAHE